MFGGTALRGLACVDYSMGFSVAGLTIDIAGFGHSGAAALQLRWGTVLRWGGVTILAL